MRDVTIHQKQDGWTAVKTRKKKSDDKPPRQECHSLSTMSFQSNDCNLQSYAHLVYITPSLLKRKNLALQSKNPAQRRWSSLLVNQWRLDFHDQGQNLQIYAISQKVPTDQNTRNLIRERREHVSQVTAACGLSSTCGTTCGEPQLNLELACSRWWRCFYLAAIGCTGSLGNSCFLWCIPSLAFDQNWLVDIVWQRQYGRWLSW